MGFSGMHNAKWTCMLDQILETYKNSNMSNHYHSPCIIWIFKSSVENKHQIWQREKIQTPSNPNVCSVFTSKLSWQVSVYFSAEVMKFFLFPNFPIRSLDLCLCTVKPWKKKEEESAVESAVSCFLICDNKSKRNKVENAGPILISKYLCILVQVVRLLLCVFWLWACCL